MEEPLNLVDEVILNNFKKCFSHLKNNPIILYGLGEKTKLLLENLQEYNFVALMDGEICDCEVYGLPVISTQKASSVATNIIIVCNVGVTRIIYKRIIHLEVENRINIYHVNGERMKGPVNDKKNRLYCSQDKLKNKIDQNNIISFDIFDTILMRKCLHPSDIFAIIDTKMQKEFNININFANIRLMAERHAYHNLSENFTLDDIYRAIQEKTGLPEETISLIKEIEIQTEYDYIITRKDMVKILDYAKEQKKYILFVSDMYLPKNIIKKMLNKYQLTCDEFFISCEIKMSKHKGDLWGNIIKKYDPAKILHIGDNYHTDIQQAKEYGINTFKIPSAGQMYEALFTKYLPATDKKEDKLLLGTFVAKALNSPFALTLTGKLSVCTMYDLGYLFYGPLIANFIFWLKKMGEKLNISTFLFVSRDGYILNKLYNSYPSKKKSGIYFYSSRRAMSLAIIQKEEDIEDVFTFCYPITRITFEHFMASAFSIKILPSDKFYSSYMTDVNKQKILSHIVACYGHEIIERGRIEAKAYLDYIASLEISPKTKIAIVDFTSAGTVQFCMAKLLPDFDIEYLFFLSQIGSKDGLINTDRRHTLYGENLHLFTAKNNSLVKHALIAEVVFSSPDEQLLYMRDAQPVFGEKTKRDFFPIEESHQGIQDFFSDLVQDDFLRSKTFSSQLCDSLFGIQFNDEIVSISQKIKESFIKTDYLVPSTENIVKSDW